MVIVQTRSSPFGGETHPMGLAVCERPSSRPRALKGIWGKVIVPYTQIAVKTLRH